MLRFLLPTALAATWLLVAATPALAQSAAKQFHLVAANSNNATVLKPQSGVVVGAQLSGIGAAPAYLKFYDKATAPTCGTDTPSKVLMIPAAGTAANGAGSNITISLGAVFNNGIGICVVTGITDADNTSVAAATFQVNIDLE
jgi:hypothetical protein